MIEYAVVIPIRTVSEANQREHWAAKAKRTKDQRETVATILRSARHVKVLKKHGVPSLIVLTRLSAGTLDFDNCVSSFKGTVDGIQDALGINDRLLKFEYRQERCKRGQYSVKIEFKWESAT